MNYKITIQYDGTKYDGWQRQKNTENTIQGKIERILSRMTDAPVEIDGAGRTDAGVHALGQTASFRLWEQYDALEVKAYLNRYLPEDIEVVSCVRASERFHARLNARGKIYRYQIGMNSAKNVFYRRYRYGIDETLDLDAMRIAASYCVGKHDFKSFCGNRRMKKSTIRNIWSIDFYQDGDEVYITYHGDGFLNHMIRIMTGTFIEVGMGKRKAEELPAIIEGKDRELAGFLAPARGLTLVEVEY